MKKLLCFIIVGILCFNLCSCSSEAVMDDVVDQTSNIAQADNENILAVKGGTNSNYPDVTYGDAFEAYFGMPTWKYFKGTHEGPDEDGDGKADYTEDNIDVVEFTGTCVYSDVEVKALIQFTLDKENDTFEATYLSFNRVPQSTLMLNALLNNVFESYQEENRNDDSGNGGDADKTKSGEEDEDETSSGDESGSKRYEAGEFDFCEDFPPYWYDAYPLLINEDGVTTMAVYAEDDHLAIDIDDARRTVTIDSYGEEIGHLRHKYYCEDGSELTVAYADTENVVRFVPGEGTYGEGLYHPVVGIANRFNSFICPESDTRYLSEDEVAEIDHDFLRLARNEIYARHGRIFESKDLKDYFESQSWYEGTVSAEDFNDDEMLNRFEKANIKLISSFEEKYGIK